MGKKTKTGGTTTTTDTSDNVQNVVTVNAPPTAATVPTGRQALGVAAPSLVQGAMEAGTEVAKAAIDRDVKRFTQEQTTKRTDIEQTNTTQRREIEADQHKVTTGMTTVNQNYATYDRAWLFVDVGAIFNEFFGTEFAPNAMRAEISNLNIFLNRAFMIGGMWGPHDAQRAIEMEDYLSKLTIIDNMSGHAGGIRDAPPTFPTQPVSKKESGRDAQEALVDALEYAKGGRPGKAEDTLTAWKEANEASVTHLGSPPVYDPATETEEEFRKRHTQWFAERSNQ